ncbi:MAG TPA: hypothetical protein VEG35_03030, partial [Burkholderiales bacterium]|nr:hypothetical protein [Burkholderiales bacterium]
MSKRTVLSGLSVFLLLAALASPAPGSAKDVPVQSVWASNTVVIDGQAGDWSGESLVVNKATKAEYAFRNDGDHLYILLELKDPLFLSTLERSGVTIYWTAPGKNKKDDGLKFMRLVLSANQLIARRTAHGRKLSDDEIAAIKAKPMHTLFIYDMINKKERAKMATAKPTRYPDFSAAREGKGWIYEFRIPLAKSDDQPFGVGVEPGGTVRIGIEWGGRMQEQTQQAAQFSRSMSDADMPGQDAQVRRGEPQYTVWVDV